MTQVLRLLLVLVFVGLGIRISCLPSGAARRRGQTVFLVFVVAVSLAVGISQKDAWPFSPYPMFAEDATRATLLERIVLQGVDATGEEWPVHPLAFSPLPTTKIEEWLETVYPRLEPSRRRAAERFLLQRVEEARRAGWEGREIGRGRWLGALAAPDPMTLRDPPPPAPRPFVALRAYTVRWRPREVLGDPGRRARRLLFDTAHP